MNEDLYFVFSYTMTYQTIEATYSPRDHTIILPPDLGRYQHTMKVLVVFPSIQKKPLKKSTLHFQIDEDDVLSNSLEYQLTSTKSHKDLTATVDDLFGKKVGK